MGNKSRSVSQLKTATRCGEAYAIEKGLRGVSVPERPWPQTVAGRAFHEMLVEWEKGHRTQDAVKLFQQHWERELEQAKQEQPNLDLWMKNPGTKNINTQINSTYTRFIEKDVPQYIARCIAADWEVFRFPDGELALELPFEIQFDEDLIVRGYIDRIQWWPKQGLMSVEDTKSGSPEDELDSRQLALYRIGALESYDIDLRAGRYWFTKVDRPSNWVNLTRYSREYLHDQYKKLDATIESDNLLPRPGKHCGVCSVRPWCRELGAEGIQGWPS